LYTFFEGFETYINFVHFLIFSQIPAISASLLPPAVNAGLLWALSLVVSIFETHQVKESVKSSMYSSIPAVELCLMGCVSMCVTLTNIACIYLMGIIFLKVSIEFLRGGN
jgi:hypothetical protein